MKEKPKCAGCGEVGMEEEYWWHPRNREIWHMSCAVKAADLIFSKKTNSKEENNKRFIIGVCSNPVIEEHIKTKNKDELDKFYKKVLEKKGISKELFIKTIYLIN
jgi:hypothetical protein